MILVGSAGQPMRVPIAYSLSESAYNLIAQYALLAMQEDSKLGTGGTLEIATWEQELREDAGEYGDHELPAVAATVDLSGQDVVTTGDRTEAGYLILIMVYVAGGDEQTVTQAVKDYAARVEWVMQQQHYPAKQLGGLPDGLLNAQSGTVEVTKQNTIIDGGAVGNTLRGVAALTFGVTLDVDITEDA